MKNILSIGIYDGHVFVIKDIGWQKSICVFIVVGDSLVLIAFNGIPKLAFGVRRVDTGASGGLWGLLLMGMTPKQRLYQFQGCYWHGCRKCYPKGRNRGIDNKGKTREDLFLATMNRTKTLREADYRVVV